MNAQELRIGNWILSPDGKPFQVYEETFFDIKNVSFKPIPLTPEILEKAEFKHAIGDQVWNDCKISCVDECWWIKGLYILEKYHNNNFSFWKYTDEDTGTFLVTIKYLHQLQNLYFALTGEELEIKL